MIFLVILILCISVTGGRLVSPTRVISDGETSVDIERGLTETTEEYLLVFTPAGEALRISAFRISYT